MPRKVEELTEQEKPKRAPRARAKKVEDETSAPKPRRTRKKAEVTHADEVLERKAPTSIKEEQRQASSARKHLVIIGVLLLIGIGSSAIVGLTDKGQIDVATMIEVRNQKAEERGEKVVSVPIEELLPDGGLTAADPSASASSTPPAPVDPVATSSAPVGQVPLTNEEAAAAMQAAAASSTSP